MLEAGGPGDGAWRRADEATGTGFAGEDSEPGPAARGLREGEQVRAVGARASRPLRGAVPSRGQEAGNGGSRRARPHRAAGFVFGLMPL